MRQRTGLLALLLASGGLGTLAVGAVLAPPTPSGFTGSAQSTTSIKWTWGNVAGETGYDLHDAAHAAITPTLAQDTVSFVEPGLLENTAYTRHVHAVDGTGSSAASAAATKYTLIHNALGGEFTLTAISGYEIKITVTPPANSTLGATGCLIQRSLDNSTWSPAKNFSNVYSYNNTGLIGSTTYYYRIQFRNGDGLPSVNFSPSKSITTPAAVPPPPATLSGSAQGTTSIQWSWGNVGGETGYDVHDAAHALVKQITTADTLSYLEPGLAENTAYSRHVHAVNATGPSAASPSVTRYTLVHVPQATEFTLAAISGYEVKVTVTPPPNGTLGSTGCAIQRSTDNVNWVPAKGFSSVYSLNDLGLIGSTTYFYRIAFRNGDGQAVTAYSASKSITTPAAVPATPASFSASAQSTTSVKWGWGNVGGETGYKLHDDAHTLEKTTAADAVTFTETGLAENTRYSRHVHATNATGDSTASATVSKYTKVHDPAETEFTLTAVSGYQVNITLTPPPNSTLSSTGCVIQRSLNNTTWTAAKNFSNTYAYSDTGLVGSTLYYYRIGFRNGDGTPTAFSPSKSITTPAAPPPAAATLNGSALSPTSLRWTWGNVAGETGFTLHDAAHVEKKTTLTDQVTVDEPGLSENTSYTRHLHAVNVTGPSAASPAATKYTKIHDALAGDFTLTPLSAVEIKIDVTPPPNPAGGNTGVRIERSANGTTFSSIVTLKGTYTYTNSGLTAQTTYHYRIAYINGDGLAAAVSPSKSVATFLPPPAAPTSVNGTALSISSVQWTWSDVATETNYDLHDPVHAVIQTLPAGTTSFTETGLAENTAVTRHVHAINQGGAGPASPSATRYTKVHDPTIAEFAPQVENATSIRIVVTPPVNGFAGSTGCLIQHSPNNSTWTTIKEFSNSYEFVDAGLTANATYYYRIQLQNGDGIPSDFSLSESVKVAPPAAPTGLVGSALSTTSLKWTWIDLVGEIGYQLHDSAHNLRGSSSVDSAIFTETGLAENTSYSRHVHAVSGAGTSPASAGASAYTQVHAPGTGDFSLTVASFTQINVAVAPPPNQSAGSTGCEIQRSPNGTTWTTIKAFSNVYALNNTGLTASTTYHYRIRFRNGNGAATAYSPSNIVVSIPPPAITTPSKKVRSAGIALQGTADPSVTVRIYMNGVFEGTATPAGGSWTFTTAAKPEGFYSITARSLAASIESSDSPSVSITIDRTAPSAPTNLRTTAYNNCIDLEWDASIAGDVAGYEVFRKTGASGTWTLLNTTGVVIGTKYRDATAVNGVTYFYRVEAIDNTVSN